MQFLKKHYEKVLLSMVLLGLALAAAALPIQVSRITEELQATVQGVVRTKAKEFKPLGLSTNEAVVKRLQNPTEVKLSGIHNVFNPVVWKKKSDGSMIKVQTGNEVGPGALQITKIEELRLNVSFETVPGPNPYRVTYLKETDARPKKEIKTVKKDQPNDLFTIVQVEGPAENPTALILQLKDGQKITVPQNQGYSEVIGYAADLLYPVEPKQNFTHRRVKDTLRLENETETYKIVAITQNQVVLSAEPSQKRTTIKVKGAP